VHSWKICEMVLISGSVTEVGKHCHSDTVAESL
jgi:hypothetical protein